MVNQKICELIGNHQEVHYTGLALKSKETGMEVGYAVHCSEEVHCPYGIKDRTRLTIGELKRNGSLPDFELCPVHGIIEGLESVAA